MQKHDLKAVIPMKLIEEITHCSECGITTIHFISGRYIGLKDENKGIWNSYTNACYKNQKYLFISYTAETENNEPDGDDFTSVTLYNT